MNPEPRLYWNYGDSVMAAYEPLLRRRVRVLDHQAARGLRERDRGLAAGGARSAYVPVARRPAGAEFRRADWHLGVGSGGAPFPPQVPKSVACVSYSA